MAFSWHTHKLSSYFLETRELRLVKVGFALIESPPVKGGLDPNKISGVGTNFGLLVHVLSGPNKQRALIRSILLSWIRGQNN